MQDSISRIPKGTPPESLSHNRAACKAIIKPCKIFILGEAPGEQEELTGLPFMGESGAELSRMLSHAGIVKSDCSISNVFSYRPAGNQITEFCIDRLEWRKSEKQFPWPSSGSNCFSPAFYEWEFSRLQEELAIANPYLIIALGNTALWALTGESKISKLRGTLLTSRLTSFPYKILPTYHPAAVLRQWDLRPVVVADLIKAKRESESRDLSRPTRQIWLEPSYEDICRFEHLFFPNCETLTIDIETAFEQITCIGFAPNKTTAICIPFIDMTKPDRCFYSREEELKIWKKIREWLALPLRKRLQNGLYDLQYLYRYGASMKNFTSDTMLAHHSLYPELPKDLGFLGSIYTDEPAWKMMRPRGGEGTKLKKDD